jgi:hypothetical protein
VSSASRARPCLSSLPSYGVVRSPPVPSTSIGPNFSAIVTGPDNAIWTLGSGVLPDGGLGGSFSLTITSPGPPDAGIIGLVWNNAHGTLFADLVPDVSGSGRYTPNTSAEDVVVCASF